MRVWLLVLVMLLVSAWSLARFAWAWRRALLLAAWRQAQWRRLAGRRADFAAVGAPDLTVTQQELWRVLPDQAAALRTVVLGGAVVQGPLHGNRDVLSLPRGFRDSPQPHVGLPALQRGTRYGFGVPVGCPAGSAATGVLAADTALEATAHDRCRPRRRGGDGNLFAGSGALLARSGWAVVG